MTALPAISGRSEEKLAAAATTRMLCDLPALQVTCPVALASRRNVDAPLHTTADLGHMQQHCRRTGLHSAHRPLGSGNRSRNAFLCGSPMPSLENLVLPRQHYGVYVIPQDAAAAPLWGQLLTAQLQLLAADRPANGGDESAEEPEESVGELKLCPRALHRCWLIADYTSLLPGFACAAV